MAIVRFMVATAALVVATSAAAQAPATLVHAGDAEVRALIDKVHKERQSGQMVASTPILRHDGYTALLEHRIGPGNVNVHEVSAEFFHVLEGSGTLVTGGTVVEPKRSGTNVTGTDIIGGETRTVKAGDIFVIPAGVPHWFKTVDGKLVMTSIHLPKASRVAPAP